MNPEILFNGQPSAGIPYSNRALHYGDGVFRTCFIYSNEVIDINEHIEKVIADAKRLDIVFEQPQLLHAEARQLASGQNLAVLKILLMRSGAERGYRSSGRAADRLLQRGAAPNYPACCWEQGVQLFRSSFRLAAQPALAGIKHLNRLEQVLASRDWPPGADEGLMNDDQNRPVSGTRSNLFWVRDGTLCTPALDRCGVAGLTRDKLLRIASSLGLATRIAAASWEELYRAQEMFVCNSLIGIWPVRAIENWTAAAPGAVTRRLSDVLAHPRLVHC